MRLKLPIRTFLSLALLLAPLVSARAQPATSMPTNLMMRLMMSQPSVDISAPVEATASFDPPQVAPGEKAVYRVTFNAIESSIRLPDRIPAPPELKGDLTAHGQILRPGAGKYWPLSSFVYEVRGNKPGLFTIPSYVAEVYGKAVWVPEAYLEVVKEPPESHQSAERLEVEAVTTNAYVGEALRVRVLLPGSVSNVAQMLSQVQINGDGFLANKNAIRQSIQALERNGRRVPTFIYETDVTPIAVGPQALSAQAYATGRQMNGAVVIRGQVTLPGGTPEYVLLDSDSITINVRPLPMEGRLPGFTGAIGVFNSDPPHLSTNTVRAGEPVQLRVTIRGPGDVERIVPPPPPRVRDWQVFPADSAGMVGGNRVANHGIIFNYTMIPMTEEAKATPAIPFSCFDPAEEKYVDLTIPPVPITVLANGMPTNWEASTASLDTDFEQEEKPSLSGLAKSRGEVASSLIPLQLRGWFPLVQFIPALGFGGLWFWDRRRRHLERHPEILRRRRARRELRRQKRKLKRALARADAAGYARCAIAALQTVCAPFFPANPRALVCGDVLSLLNATDRQGRTGEAVKRFFAVADAAVYATSPPNQAELMALQSELKEVLDKLEERL